MLTILYVPLDERACNLRFPGLLAEMAGDINLIAPPKALMGRLKVPADAVKLWDWVFEQAPRCDVANLSVDALVYGNIVASRTHHKSIDECERLLGNFRRLKALCPRLVIHAFNLVARVAGYDSDAEDPDYWATHGRAIWRHACLTDKAGRGLANETEREELDRLSNAIPKEYLSDFLARRTVDRRVNLLSIDLLKDGVFCDLVIPKDDTAEYGYAAMDQRAVAEKVWALNLMHRVMVYPGADEVGSVLFARAFCEYKGYAPRVLVRYSSTLGPTVVPLYEDRPLNESIKAQVTSAGGLVADCAADSDLMLAVHSPGIAMAEAATQRQKPVTYYSHACVHEFFRYIRHYATLGKACALADVCYANGADIEMVEHAQASGVLDAIDAYGGWNTAMNTVGVALAHGIIASWLNHNCASEAQRIRSQEFLLRKLIEDWLYQAGLLNDAAANPRAYFDRQINPYALGGDEAALADVVLKHLRERISTAFPDGFRGQTIVLGDLSFPWGRLFDIDFDIALEG